MKLVEKSKYNVIIANDYHSMHEKTIRPNSVRF